MQELKVLTEELNSFGKKYKELEDKIQRILSEVGLESGSLEPNIEKPVEVKKSTKNLVKRNLAPCISQLDIERECFEYVGYITICSSVVSSGIVRKSSIKATVQKKASLYGASDDVFHIKQLFKCLGNSFKKEGKYEFSKESVTSLNKVNFLSTLQNFFDFPKDASIFYYSGHGFENTDLLFECGFGNYFINYDDIVSLWKKRKNPNNNKVLLIILDCCYSGSWVNKLLQKGDFKDIMIQASSSYNQLSNDLGENLGSLFTNYFISKNLSKGLTEAPKNFNEIESHLEKKNVIELLKEQEPRGFCFRDLKDINFDLDSINLNAWQTKSITELNSNKDKFILNVRNYQGDDPLFSCNPHVVFILTEGCVTFQGELPYKTDIEEGKYEFYSSYNSREIRKVKAGRIAIFQDNKVYMGFYFNSSFNNENELKFIIDDQTIEETVNKLTITFNNGFKNNKLELEEELLLKLISSLTICGKSNLSDDYIFLENDLEENDNILENVDQIEGNMKSSLRVVNLGIGLSKGLGHKINNFMKSNKNLSHLGLVADKSTNGIDSILINTAIKSLSIILGQQTKPELINSLEYLNLNLKEIKIQSDLETTTFIENIFLSSKLVKLELNGIIINSNLHLISLSAIENLVYFSISNIKTSNSSQVNLDDMLTTLFENFESHAKLKTLKVISCQLKSVKVLNNNLTEIDFTDNSIGDDEVMQILDLLSKMKFPYRINLSQNFITNSIGNSIGNFIRKNEKCHEFDISQNFLNDNEMYNLTKLSTIGNNNIIHINLSYVKFTTSVFDGFIKFLKNNKQLKSVNISSSNLNEKDINKFFDIITINSNNTISKIDISNNQINSIGQFKQILSKIAFSKRLLSLNMDSCVNLSKCKSNFDFTLLFKSQLEELNISNWKCGQEFRFFAKEITKSKLKYLKALNSKIKYLPFVNKKFQYFESDLFSFLIISFESCTQLSLYIEETIELDDEGISLFVEKLNGLNETNSLEELHFTGNSYCYDNIEKILTRVSIFNTSSEITSNANSISSTRINYFVGENLDVSSSEFLLEFSNSENINETYFTLADDIRDYGARNKISNFKKNLSSPKTLNKFTVGGIEPDKQVGTKIALQNKILEVSAELKNYILNNNLLLDLELFQNMISPFESIRSNVKYLRLNRNTFNINEFEKITLQELEVLELDMVYARKFFEILKRFAEKNKVKCLIIKNTELNSKELNTLTEILSIMKTQIEELHLVNTFIDGKEFSFFVNKCSKMNLNLRVLNLSGNYLNESFVNSLKTMIQNSNIEYLYLQDTCLSLELLKYIISLYQDKTLEVLDISGFKLDKLSTINDLNQFKNGYVSTISYSNEDIKYGPVDQYPAAVILNYVDLEKIKNKLLKFFQNKHIYMLVVRNITNQSTYLSILRRCLRNTTLNYLDLRYCIINEYNVDYFIKLMRLLDKTNIKVKINVSVTNLEDKPFSYISHELLKSRNLVIESEDNMLTSTSSYNLLMKFKNYDDYYTSKIILKNSFCGELDYYKSITVNTSFKIKSNTEDKISSIRSNKYNPLDNEYFNFVQNDKIFHSTDTTK